MKRQENFSDEAIAKKARQSVNLLEDVLPRELEQHVCAMLLDHPDALSNLARASTGLYERTQATWRAHCQRLLARVEPLATVNENLVGAIHIPNEIKGLKRAQAAQFPNAENLCHAVYKKVSEVMVVGLCGYLNDDFARCTSNGRDPWVFNERYARMVDDAGATLFEVSQEILEVNEEGDALMSTCVNWTNPRRLVTRAVKEAFLRFRGYLESKAVWESKKARRTFAKLAQQMFFTILTNVTPLAQFQYVRIGSAGVPHAVEIGLQRGGTLITDTVVDDDDDN
jgi:hypothetical protein